MFSSYYAKVKFSFLYEVGCLDIEKLISKVSEKYANCSTYRDRGELRTSVSCWGSVQFQTYFLAPKNLLVRIMYGPPEKPTQTDTFWTNGTGFYLHTSGAKNNCELIKGEVDFYAFGMGTLFDFEVPMLLFPDAQRFSGRFTRSKFEIVGDDRKQGLIHLRRDEESNEGAFENSFEVFVNKNDCYLRRVKCTESYAAMPTVTDLLLHKHPTLVAPMKSMLLGGSATTTPKLLLMLGKPDVFPIQPISTECIYHDVAFDEEISPALFSFSPPAES